MKKIMFLMAALAVTTFIFGQRIQKGEKQVNAGIGFNNGGWSLPVYAGFDLGVHPDITVGATLSYVQQTFDYKNRAHWFGLGARGDYHFNTLLNIPNKWDAYAGVTLVYNNLSYSDNFIGVLGVSGVGLGMQIGGRYYFTDNLGVNLELGGGSIALGGRLGISFKF